MQKIKTKLGLCSVTFMLLALPYIGVFANENTQTDSNTNSVARPEENLKPSVPPPKEPQKDKVTPKIRNNSTPQAPQTSEQSSETQKNDSHENEKKPEETEKKESPKETKKQDTTVPPEGDSGSLGEKAESNEQESQKTTDFSEMDLPEVDESDIDTESSFIQNIITYDKKDLVAICLSCILVLSGLFIVIKVIIANFKIPKGYQPSTKSKHNYSKRKKYTYNIKR